MLALVLAVAMSNTVFPGEASVYPDVSLIDTAFPDQPKGGGAATGIASQTFVASYANLTLAATVTKYMALSGMMLASQTNCSTEANTVAEMQTGGTFQNARAYVFSNSLDAAATITLRKNAGDAAIAMTVGAAATGEFEDTGNTVTYVAGDEVTWEFDLSGATSGSLGLGLVQLEATGSTSRTNIASYCQANVSQAQQKYASLNGAAFVNNAQSTLANMETEMYRAGTLANARVYVATNTMDGDTVVTLMKNGVATSITWTISAAATGEFKDTSNEVTFSTNDTIVWEVDTTASTSGGFAPVVFQIEET